MVFSLLTSTFNPFTVYYLPAEKSARAIAFPTRLQSHKCICFFFFLLFLLRFARPFFFLLFPFFTLLLYPSLPSPRLCPLALLFPIFLLHSFTPLSSSSFSNTSSLVVVLFLCSQCSTYSVLYKVVPDEIMPDLS